MLVIDGKIIELNRDDVEISEVDEAFYNLAKRILEEGVLTPNRTGVDTIAIGNWDFDFHLDKGFPILESKLVSARNMASEIEWIHLEQTNKVQWLRDRENRIWDDWVVDEDGIYRSYEQGPNAVHDPERMVPLLTKVWNSYYGKVDEVPVTDIYGKPIMVKSLDLMQGKENPRTIKKAIWFGREYAGTIGEAYGFMTATYHGPQSVELALKNNPTDRRMKIELDQYTHRVKAVLEPCVHLSEFTCIGDTLYAAIDQRSGDVGAGVPFNIPQYALLFSMYAKTRGLKMGPMHWHITNAHIYVNQIEAVKKQQRRYEYMVEYRDIIKKTSDGDLQRLYDKLKENFEMLHKRVAIRINSETVDIEKLKMSDRVEILKTKDAELAAEYEESYERKIAFEHMVTRKTPRLELADHDSIFDYSRDYVSKNDPYMKENPIGNKELVLKNYTPTPFIKMPVAK